MAQISCKRDIAGRTTVSGWPYEHCHKQSRHKVSVPFVWKENGFVPDSEKPTFPGVRDKIDGCEMTTHLLGQAQRTGNREVDPERALPGWDCSTFSIWSTLLS